MLTTLPPEIFESVAQCLPDKEDLKSLSLVSRAIHAAVQRTLWESLDLSPIKEEEPWHFRVKTIFGNHLPAFRYATQLNFNSPFRQRGSDRCPHCRDDKDALSGDEGADSRFKCLANATTSIAEIIPAHRLRKFTWGLGTCVPGRLLGRRGILGRQQPDIQSLSLITSGNCMAWDIIDLSPFQNLKSLSWKSPDLGNFEAIAEAFLNNREHLSHLELDFVDWEGMRDRAYPYQDDELDPFDDIESNGFFGNTFLDFAFAGLPLFPALRVMSLTTVPLRGPNVHSFDFEKMQSLKIINCPGWHLFLAEITGLELSLQLKTLEIRCMVDPDQPAAANEHNSLVGFIRSFAGLEDLFLGIARQLDTLDLWRQITTQHGATLKRFIHHQRDVFPPHVPLLPGDTPFSREMDMPDLNLGLDFQLVHQENPLASMIHLKSIALSCVPEVLGPIFASFTRQPLPSSLELLHIRQSRSDWMLYGSWVTVGNEGRPEIMEEYDGQVRHLRSLGETRYGRPHDLAPETVDSLSEAIQATRPVPHPAPARGTAAPITGDSRLPDKHLPGLEKDSILRGQTRRFANWAFGKTGLPNLRVIALGDFEHGRFDKRFDNMFLIRREPGPDEKGNYYDIFWVEERGGQNWSGLVESHWEFLGACPGEPLVLFDDDD